MVSAAMDVIQNFKKNPEQYLKNLIEDGSKFIGKLAQ